MAAAYQGMIDRHLHGDVLDLGCGSVPLFALYRACSAATVTTIDWPKTLHDATHIDAFADLSMPLPLRDRIVDTVVLTDVLEHVATPDLLIAEAQRVLRPLGKLLIGVPFLYPVHEQPHDYHRYTEYRLRQLCSSHGLEVIELEPYGGALDVLCDISAKLVQHLPGLRLATDILGFANARWGGYARRKTARKFPLGYVVVARRI